jgi:hypothetical protein
MAVAHLTACGDEMTRRGTLHKKMTREWLTPGPTHLRGIGVGFLVCCAYRAADAAVPETPDRGRERKGPASFPAGPELISDVGLSIADLLEIAETKSAIPNLPS